MAKVLIVEDQNMPRQLMELLVTNSPDFELAGSIQNSSLALSLCKVKEVDLILMDVITLFDNCGLDAARDIKAEFPNIKIIIVTSMPEFSWIQKAKEIGIESFYYKDCSDEEILTVMRRTMEGESIYPASTPTLRIGNATNHDFSNRELEVIKAMADGKNNQEIGEELFISSLTVKTHIQNIFQKTGFKTRSEVVSEAVRLGIVVKNM